MTITIRIQRRQASMGTGRILLLIAVVFSVMFQAVLLSHYYFPSQLIDTLSGNSGRQQLLLSTNHEDLMINFNSNSHIAITNTTPSSLSSSSSSNSILISMEADLVLKTLESTSNHEPTLLRLRRCLPQPPPPPPTLRQ